jgi:hypothetical protein
VPVAEVRALVTQLFDPDGAGQAAPHLKVSTWSGRPFRPARTLRPDLGSRATELSQWVHEYLVRQRAALFSGRQMSMAEADDALDEWAACYIAEGPRCLAVVPDPEASDAFAVHATNVATVGMCFAADLGLDARTLREIAELSLMAALMETTLPPSERLAAGAGLAPLGCQRLATLALSQLRHRRAPAYAVMAYELAREYRGESSRGVGVVPSVVTLAEAWAALAFKSRLGHIEGVRLLTTQYVQRFSPEILGLFANWVKAQFTM